MPKGKNKPQAMELTTLGTNNVLLGGDEEAVSAKSPSEVDKLRNEVKILQR